MSIPVAETLAAAVMVISAGHAEVPEKPAAEPCRSRSCRERVARKQCSQTRPRVCVERAILTYHLHGWRAAWMRRVPGCESRWQPLAYFPMQIADTTSERRFAIEHDRSAGLYAFKPSTWKGLRRYRDESIFSAKWSALAAGLMVQSGRTGEWACT